MKIRSNSGQVIIEYILLLVMTAGLAALIVKQLASRNEDDAGVLVKKWQQIQIEIGNDVPDRCDAGGACN